MPTLLAVRAASWTLEISGPAKVLPSFLPSIDTSSRIVGRKLEVWVWESAMRKLVELDSSERHAPLFFENTTYNFYLFSESDHQLVLPRSTPEPLRRPGFEHYTINFQNDVGFFDISVLGSDDSATIQLEVFPSKIDYRTDYVRIREDISAISRRLIYWVISKTYGSASPDQVRHQSTLEWISLLEGYFRDLMNAGRALSRNPHSSLLQITNPVDASRSRIIDERRLASEMRRSPQRSSGIHRPSGLHLPGRLPEKSRTISYNTPINQYVKAVLFSTVRRLNRIAAMELPNPADEDSDLTAAETFFVEFRSVARRMAKEIHLLLNSTFLAEADISPAIQPSSLVLTRHPHYAALNSAIRKLNAGLAVGTGLLRIGLRDIATLYEYWCFLKIVDLLRSNLELQQQDLVRIRELEFSLVLEKGRASTVAFIDPNSGRRVELVYNRLFNALPTVGQRPDNVIEIAQEDSLLILDAKYRLAFDDEYLKLYNLPGPTAADINTMHRYRDAIVIPARDSSGQFERVVRAALVLFPWNDENGFKEHKFFRSVGSVRIGALPFLPETTEMVREELQHLILSSGT